VWINSTQRGLRHFYPEISAHTDVATPIAITHQITSR